MIRLLIVDDEPLLLIATKTFLEKDNADIECDTCSSAQEALDRLAAFPYDAIASDYEMPHMNGIALLKAVRAEDPEIPFILLTGRGREEVVIEALNHGADFYLQKSTEPRALYAELASKLRHAVDRRRARETLMRTQFSIDHLPAEFYWIDFEGHLIDVNESACRKLGYTRDELFAMRVPDVDPDFALQGFEGAWQDAWQDLKEHTTLCMESHHRKRDGTVYPVELSLTYCRMGENEFMCAFATDITERKRGEKALKNASKKLNLLTSITRHDILNQVTALKAFLAFLQEGDTSEAEARDLLWNLENIADTIRRQILFTGDYQDMGERDPEWQRVERVMKRAAASVRMNRAVLAVETGSLEILADPMLEKAFYNLLDNAVCHGEWVEHITVSFHEDGDAGVLVFEDDGAGVPASLKVKIFDRGFGKITGYGLFLVKEILDITDLSIRETGEEGRGARFEIEVPAGTWRIAAH